MTTIFSWWQCIVRSRESSAHCTWLSPDELVPRPVHHRPASAGTAAAAARPTAAPAPARAAPRSASRSRSGSAPGSRVSAKSGDACQPAMCTEVRAALIAASIAASASVPSTSTSTWLPERTAARVAHQLPPSRGDSASDHPRPSAGAGGGARSTASRPSPALASIPRATSSAPWQPSWRKHRVGGWLPDMAAAPVAAGYDPAFLGRAGAAARSRSSWSGSCPTATSPCCSTRHDGSRPRPV